MDDIPIQKTPLGEDNLIVEEPLEFRRAEWSRGSAILCLRREAERFEAHRREALSRPGHQHIRFVPNHFALTGGCHYTLAGLLKHRENEPGMRRVYRLAGYMECVTGARSPVLRTDLLRRFHEEILREREELGVVWRGGHERFLFPLHSDLYNPNRFLHRVEGAETLQDLFEAVVAETDEQFLILSKYYTFYIPLNMFAGEASHVPE